MCPGEEQEPPVTVPSEPSNHPVALRVRDLGASSAFYRDLFGLEPAADRPATGPRTRKSSGSSPRCWIA